MKKNEEALVPYQEEVPIMESEEVPGTAIDGTTNIEEEQPPMIIDESYFILPNQSPDKDKSNKDKSDKKPDDGNKDDADKDDEGDKSDEEEDKEGEDGEGDKESDQDDGEEEEGEGEEGEPTDGKGQQGEGTPQDPFGDLDDSLEDYESDGQSEGEPNGDGKTIPIPVNHELRDEDSEFIRINRKDRNFFR